MNFSAILTMGGIVILFFIVGCKKLNKTDPITQLEQRFTENKEGWCGINNHINIPKNTSINKLIEEALRDPIRNQGYVSKYKIVADRPISVPLPPDEEPAHAYLLETELGYQIVVAKFWDKKSYWEVRVYPGWWSAGE